MLGLELRISHVLVQPGGQALAILIDDVVGQPADRPVHADPLADQASVELRIAAIDEPDYPRAAIPAAVADPGALEYEPEALREGRARRCVQLDRDLRGQLRRNPLIRVNEVDPVVPELRKPERELPLAGESEPWLLYHVRTQGTCDRHGVVR